MPCDRVHGHAASMHAFRCMSQSPSIPSTKSKRALSRLGAATLHLQHSSEWHNFARRAVPPTPPRISPAALLRHRRPYDDQAAAASSSSSQQQRAPTTPARRCRWCRWCAVAACPPSRCSEHLRELLRNDHCQAKSSQAKPSQSILDNLSGASIASRNSPYSSMPELSTSYRRKSALTVPGGKPPWPGKPASA